MRLALAGALVLSISATAMASECPLHKAQYGQPDDQLAMEFLPVPQGSPANQIAAFRITLPDSPSTALDGAIFIPNGYGQPLGGVTLDCAPDTECQPFWEGQVYALVDGGITRFPWDADLPTDAQQTPDQVLLPAFASSVWYSMLRESAFAGPDLLDTFTFRRCADGE